MSERTTRTDYSARLDRVVTWLTDHLDEELDLARLAEVSCLSPYHFHRIYHGMQGETVAETVRRLRLHRAAVELITGTRPVERIATRAGYGSQEAFTRAFSAAYGTPPARYRASFASPPAAKRRTPMDTTTRYEATIRETPPITVAALPHKGDYQQIGSTFERLSVLAAAQGLSDPASRSFGIYYDDPDVVAREALRSDACVTVPADWTTSGELQRREIRGGRYAIALHTGPYAQLHLAYEWLFGTWLANSDEEAADSPCVEEYLNNPRTLPPTGWQTEVWFPLK